LVECAGSGGGRKQVTLMRSGVKVEKRESDAAVDANWRLPYAEALWSFVK